MRIVAALLLAAVAALGLATWLSLWTPGARPPSACSEVAEEPARLEAALAAHVEHLAGRIGPRSPEHTVALEAAGAWIEERLRELGWRTRRQAAGPSGAFFNVVAEPDASAPLRLVIGAHYDTVATSPGADDDASGVAALLEIARMLGPRAAGLRLAAFTNEEHPLGRTAHRGSLVAARESRARGERLLGMLALEMLGYYTDEPGSQRHPSRLGLFFPDRGDHVAWVANPSSRALLHDAIAAFRAASPLPAEGTALWERLVPHVRRSDHAAYWDEGYAALLVTDTADFRNPHYHRDSDLPATLDYRRLAQATIGVAAVARCLLADAGAPVDP